MRRLANDESVARRFFDGAGGYGLRDRLGAGRSSGAYTNRIGAGASCSAGGD